MSDQAGHVDDGLTAHQGPPAVPGPVLPSPLAQLGVRNGPQVRVGPGHPYPPGTLVIPVIEVVP